MPTCCSAKVSDAGDTVAEGATPTPDNATASVIVIPPAPLKFRFIVADSLPNTLGVNTTSIVQLVPTAKIAPQVLLGEAKSAANMPPNIMPWKFRSIVPVFFNVTATKLVGSSTCALPKLNARGVTLTKANSSAPTSATLACGLEFLSISITGAPFNVPAL